MNHKIDQVLLQSYFDGTCSPAERRMVELWLAADNHTDEETAMMERIFDNIDVPADNDTYAALQTVSSKIRRQSMFHIKRWAVRAGYAAAMVVLCAVSYFGMTKHKIQPNAIKEKQVAMVDIYVPCGQTRQVELPDGSVITLAADSRLTYPATFADDIRNVTLVGECYASIAKNPEKPFVLSAGGINIVVKGTQFNVKSYSDMSELEVALVEGSVVVENKVASGNDKINLVPGQLVKIDNRTGNSNVSSFCKEVYRPTASSKSLTFVNEQFCDIVKALERTFNIKIEITNDSLAQERFYASFVNGENLDVILSTFNAAETMRIVRKDNNIYISSNE